MKTYPPRLEGTDSSERYSIELKTKQQLTWINFELGKSSGTEHHALAKASGELLDLTRSLAEIRC